MSRNHSHDTRSPSGEALFCSFCGRAEDDVGALIAGPSAFICENCVEDCNKLIDVEFGATSREAIEALPKPRDIHGYLDNYIVGQEQAKKILAVSVYNHYKRLAHNRSGDRLEITKSNILLVGPSGSGKTLLAETLARYLDVPFAVADATSLTEAGYVGEDVESVIQKLLQACDFDAEKASRGIVYIDEIDKLARRSLNPTHGRDVGGEGVQQGLLKMIEGTVVSIPVRGNNKRSGHQEQVQVDTRNILFICGGAFAGLEKVVARRAAPRGIGFGAPVEADARLDLRKELETSDLVEFGLIPEFIGRLPVAAVLDGLDEDALVRILTEPKNSLVRQYVHLFSLDGCELEITEDALRAAAREALARGTGARGLRAVLEGVLLDAMYTVPARGDVTRVIIDGDCLKGQPAAYEFASLPTKIAQ